MLTVVGAGAVGTTLAAYLSAAQRPIRIYARDKDRLSFEHAGCLRLERPNAPTLTAPLPPLCSALVDDSTRMLLLATKFSALDGLIDQIQHLRGHGGDGLTLISSLNGVQAVPLLHRRLPNAQVMPLTIMFNSQYPAPLHAQLTTKPAVILGGNDTEILKLLKGIGLHVSQSQGERACWGKLLINLGNAIGALTQGTFRDLLSNPDLRAVFVAAMDEALDRLQAAKIDYQLPMPIPYPAYRWLLLKGGGLPWKLAQIKNGLADGAYPSMVSDIRAGRATEVRQLNGEIASLGEQLRWPAPINSQLVSLVESITQAEKPTYSAADLRKALLG